MAFNIAIKSKYDPFTYDDIVKPLESYWKKYDLAEEALYEDQVKIEELGSIVDNLPKGEHGYLNPKDQQVVDIYNKYKQEIDAAATSLASNGYSNDIKSKIKGLKPLYEKTITPLLKAAKMLQADKQAYAEKLANPDFVMGSTYNPWNASIMDYAMGEYPAYYTTANISDIEKEGMILGKQLSQDQISVSKNSEIPGTIKLLQGISPNSENFEKQMAALKETPAFKEYMNSVKSHFKFDDFSTYDQERMEDAFLRGMIGGFHSSVSYQHIPRAPQNPGGLNINNLTPEWRGKLEKAENYDRYGSGSISYIDPSPIEVETKDGTHVFHKIGIKNGADVYWDIGDNKIYTNQEFKQIEPPVTTEDVNNWNNKLKKKLSDDINKYNPPVIAHGDAFYYTNAQNFNLDPAQLYIDNKTLNNAEDTPVHIIYGNITNNMLNQADSSGVLPSYDGEGKSSTYSKNDDYIQFLDKTFYDNYKEGSNDRNAWTRIFIGSGGSGLNDHHIGSIDGVLYLRWLETQSQLSNDEKTSIYSMIIGQIGKENLIDLAKKAGIQLNLKP